MSGVSGFSSRSPSQSTSATEPFSSDVPEAAEAESPFGSTPVPESMCTESSDANLGVQQLVRADSGTKERIKAFLINQPSARASTLVTTSGNSSWERASSHEGTKPYARIGTNPQQDIVFAEAAGTKGKVSDGSGTVEVFSASVQRGAQYEGQVTMAKVEVGTDANHIDASALTAEAHVGSYNPDGSVGYNAGVSANIVAGEAQVSREGNSVTFGLSAGFGAEVSLGERDSDDDGQTEYCVRVGAGPFTVGVCIEPATMGGNLQ